MRAHRRIAAGLFAGLGLQVGVWAVLIPELVASRDLEPAALGLGLAVMAATSIGALAAAGPLADRIGRRPLAVAGAAGFAVAFALLAGVEAQAALWPTLALYGVASGFLDLAANAIGSDYERAHRVRAMIRLHAGFSGAAAVGALLAGAVGPDTYWIATAVYVVLAGAAAVAPLPPHEAAAHDPPAGAAHESSVAAGEAAGDDSPGEGAGGRLALLRNPAIAVAVALCTLCFFGDGALEGYAALFLRDVLESGALLTGAALAAFHGASMVGRLVFSRPADERLVLTIAGLLASAAMALVVLAREPAVAAAGLLIVGFALAPGGADRAVAGRPQRPRAQRHRGVAGHHGRLQRVRPRPAVRRPARERDVAAHRADPGRRLDGDDRRAGPQGTVNKVSRDLVFGYGSLPAEEAGVECCLHDHRCDWDVAMDNREVIPGYKVYVDPETGERPAVEVAYLSISPHEGARVDGVAIPVSDDKLAALDRRERNYDRREVTHLVAADLGGRIWAYFGKPDARRRLARGRRRGTAVVSRGYVDMVRVAVPPDLPVRALVRRDVGT